MLRISRASQFCLDSMISISSSFFFFNDTATTEIYTLSLHDALPISRLLPKGTHHYQEFIKPAELARWLREADMQLVDVSGMAYEPWRNHARLSSRTDINYLAYAVKPA